MIISAEERKTTMAVSKEMTVFNKVGLHARPAAMFVKKAAPFKSKISVVNLSKETQPANAKSLLSVLSIGVQKDDRILVTCDGEDEAQALVALVELVAANFGEE
jgi:phosphocarrier protein HPr